jgi:oligopeptidase B
MTPLPDAPRAERRPSTRTHHGDTIVDDFEWLRDKDDPAVRAYLDEENAYTRASTAHLGQLRQSLFDEIKSRTLETDLSVPVRHGAYWYYSRTIEGRQYGIHCRIPVSGDDDWTPPDLAMGDDREEVLLDDNVEAEGTDFYSLGSFDVSTDGRLLAYSVDTAGDERYTLFIRDLETGTNLADVVPNTFPGATFSPDASVVFYPTVDDAWRPDTIWRHTVGSDASLDTAVFTEPDERYWVGVGLTRSGRFLVLDIASKITSEVRILDTEDVQGDFRVVWPRREGIEYQVEHAIVSGEDRLLIVHNEGAEDFQVVDVPAERPLDQDAWRTVVPASPGRRIEEIDAFAGHLTLEYRRDGLTRVAVIRLGDGDEPFGPIEEIPFDETLFQVGTGGNPEWSQHTVRLGYTSFVTPSTVFDFSIDDGTMTLLKRQAVQGDYDPLDYVQERVWATADDGARIPISLVSRRLEEPRMPRPTLLYGYGSYEASIDPGFSVPRLSLLDRGVVFAIAHVRTGQDALQEEHVHGLHRRGRRAHPLGPHER